jgi:PIN domain nuclease of toxin-antitoxin system
MRLIVDSHALIWYVDQDYLLGPKAHAAIDDPANELWVSAATVWEIAIKVGLNKLTLSLPYRDWMAQALADLDAAILPVTLKAADIQRGLPWHHRDPFDRLIVSQSLAEGVPIISKDAILDQ